MTTIEHEITTRVPTVSPPAERAVFVTDADHRSRRLGMGVRVAGGLALLWAVGLSIGMLGSGHLPGISLPSPLGSDDRPDAGRPTGADLSPQVFVAGRAATNTGGLTRGLHAVRSERASPRNIAADRITGRTKLRTVAPRRSAPSAPPGQAVAAPVPASPQPVRRGLVRRGLTAPPGQDQKAANAPPAETPPGQTRRRDLRTTAPTPPTEPLPPGQQKPDKPPPPPKG